MTRLARTFQAERPSQSLATVLLLLLLYKSRGLFSFFSRILLRLATFFSCVMLIHYQNELATRQNRLPFEMKLVETRCTKVNHRRRHSYKTNVPGFIRVKPLFLYSSIFFLHCTTADIYPLNLLICGKG